MWRFPKPWDTQLLYSSHDHVHDLKPIDGDLGYLGIPSDKKGGWQHGSVLATNYPLVN